MVPEKIVRRIDTVLSLGTEAKKHIWMSQFAQHVNSDKFYEFKAASLSLITSIVGEGHVYFREFVAVTARTEIQYLNSGLGVLLALKRDVEEGWLFDLKGLVSSEIFSDFLEMASYLLKEGYKDPAAVMIGGVLEEHLRQLCIKNNIQPFNLKDGREVPKKADSMNSELAAAGVYGKLEQKNIVAWLDLRNKAAHGLYSEFRKEQVEMMEMGVSDFLGKVSL